MNSNLIKLLVDIAENKEAQENWEKNAFSMLKEYQVDSCSTGRFLSNDNSKHGILSSLWYPAPGSPA
jgi:hypothetical protein